MHPIFEAPPKNWIYNSLSLFLEVSSLFWIPLDSWRRGNWWLIIDLFHLGYHGKNNDEDDVDVDDAVNGWEDTPAIPKHHCSRPKRTKLYSSKGILLEKRNPVAISDLYLSARPTSSTICHLPPQRPLCPPLHVNSPSGADYCNIWLFHFASDEKTAPRVLVEFLPCCYVRQAQRTELWCSTPAREE